MAHLSSGERQRLALLRALALGPHALLLDEPTASLDAEATAAVEALIDRHLSDRMAVLLVSHDPRQLTRLAARRYRVVDGVVSPDPAAP